MPNALDRGEGTLHIRHCSVIDTDWKGLDVVAAVEARLTCAQLDTIDGRDMLSWRNIFLLCYGHHVTWLTHQPLHVDTAEAKEQVPSLVLVNGEDLTPYRQASKRIFNVLARFGVAERLGMDEVLLMFVIQQRDDRNRI